MIDGEDDALPSVKFKPKIAETRWDPIEELKLLSSWEREGLYKFNKNTDKPIFSIDTPPPYASGAWHVGAAAHYVHMDMIARYYRMKGYEVYFPFGVDRNGLPVEVQVEKIYGIDAHKVPREEFLKLCKDFLDKVEEELVYIAWRLGMSCDLKNRYHTDSPEYRAVTQATFIELWKRGLIYEDIRPNIWCPRCRTTLAESEVEYSERDAILAYIKFKVVETGGDIVVATTRPELLCTCAAVIFNPEDKRYSGLEGKHVVVPIFGQKVPIMKHPYAKPEFGTGLVMVCSFGDQADVRLFRELGLKPRIAINPDGLMNEIAGPYKGLTVHEARQRILEDLKRQGLLVKAEGIVHRVPVCWRCKSPIEFVAMKEYYLKQLEFKDAIRRIANEMKFYPPEHKQLLLNWIDSISSDWPISRRRFYGTEIPIWYCKRCGAPHLPTPGKYYQPWRDPPPFKRCTKCGHTEFIGETRVFDTWMDSSITPLFILGYLRDEELFRKAFPCTLRPQGIDIVRTWLYYTLLRVYQLTGKPAFRFVRLSGMGLDEKGEAMHKSKGNIVHPIPVIERYGADALRFWAASESRLGTDYRYSEARVRAASLFLTKLWNIARFISTFPVVEEDYELMPLDLMMLGTLNDVIRKCDEGYRELDPFIPSNLLRDFIWNIFAAHYIEAVKARAYNVGKLFSEKQQRGAWFTLHECLRTILKLLAPLCPFITDAIWRRLYSQESIHKQSFPEPRSEWDTSYKELLDPFMSFNTKIWKLKKDMKKALNEPLNAIVYAPKRLEPLFPDLKVMHRIKELRKGMPSEEKYMDLGDGVYVVLI